MILVDTSVWVDHLRSSHTLLANLLERSLIVTHELVIGELACGNLKNREEILSLFSSLPRCSPATHEEVLFFIERHRLMGRGVGYVENALLAAAVMNGLTFWTRDKRLLALATELGCAWHNQT